MQIDNPAAYPSTPSSGAVCCSGAGSVGPPMRYNGDESNADNVDAGGSFPMLVKRRKQQQTVFAARVVFLIGFSLTGMPRPSQQNQNNEQKL